MIPTDAISNKKELLLEQIENFQHSGFFTEKEIDRLCAPIKLELDLLELVDYHNSETSVDIKKLNSFDELKEAIIKIVKTVKPKKANKVTNSEILITNNTNV